ncbi:hypothetical protein J3R82DRAFT_3300 [Butyriboletus roseoflavus]|nr:hypothetical protein J3R82DRAFT_3300 [Butyriboletus roseoflavus]
MFANAKALVVIVSCALVAQAGRYGTTYLSRATAPSTCIVNNSDQAAKNNGCAGYTDLPCVCASTAFQQDARVSIQANCPASDVANAMQLQNQYCSSSS